MKAFLRFVMLLSCALPMGHALASYSCTVTPGSVWGNGYQVNVTVTNDGPGSISGWTVTLNFSEPANVTSSWTSPQTQLIRLARSCGYPSKWMFNLLIRHKLPWSPETKAAGSETQPVKQAPRLVR